MARKKKLSRLKKKFDNRMKKFWNHHLNPITGLRVKNYDEDTTPIVYDTYNVEQLTKTTNGNY